MKLAVLFSYRITGVRHGLTRGAKSNVWEVMPIDVADFSDLDAPVATSWTEMFPGPVANVLNEHIDDRVDLPLTEPWGETRHTRYRDGSHYVPAERLPGVPWDEYLAIMESVSSPRRGDTRLAGLESGIGSNEWSPGVLRDIARHGNDAHSMFVSVHVSERDRRKQELRWRAESYISVDGRLYRRCDEPCIVVNKSKVTIPMPTEEPPEGIHLMISALLRVVTEDKAVRMASALGHRRYSMAEADSALSRARDFNGGKPSQSMVNGANASVGPTVYDPLCLDSQLHVLRRAQDLAGAVFLTTAKMFKDCAEDGGRMAEDHYLFSSRNHPGLDRLLGLANIRDTGTAIEFAEEAFSTLAAELPTGTPDYDRLHALAREALDLLDGRAVILDDIAPARSALP